MYFPQCEGVFFAKHTVTTWENQHEVPYIHTKLHIEVNHSLELLSVNYIISKGPKCM